MQLTTDSPRTVLVGSTWTDGGPPALREKAPTVVAFLASTRPRSAPTVAPVKTKLDADSVGQLVRSTIASPERRRLP